MLDDIEPEIALRSIDRLAAALSTGIPVGNEDGIVTSSQAGPLRTVWRADPLKDTGCALGISASGNDFSFIWFCVPVPVEDESMPIRFAGSGTIHTLCTDAD